MIKLLFILLTISTLTFCQDSTSKSKTPTEIEIAGNILALGMTKSQTQEKLKGLKLAALPNEDGIPAANSWIVQNYYGGIYHYLCSIYFVNNKIKSIIKEYEIKENTSKSVGITLFDLFSEFTKKYGYLNYTITTNSSIHCEVIQRAIFINHSDRSIKIMTIEGFINADGSKINPSLIVSETIGEIK